MLLKGMSDDTHIQWSSLQQYPMQNMVNLEMPKILLAAPKADLGLLKQILSLSTALF